MVGECSRPLAILDLDETLVFATENPRRTSFDFRCGQYFVSIRPGVTSFLAQISSLYQLAVWTSSNAPYAQCVVDHVFARDELAFVWSRGRCTRRFDATLYEEYWIKDLRKVRRRGYQLERVVFVDNTPQKLERNYGNLVKVSSWNGCPADQELKHLARYLAWLAEQPNFRVLEKRGWRQMELADPWSDLSE